MIIFFQDNPASGNTPASELRYAVIIVWIRNPESTKKGAHSDAFSEQPQ